MGKESKFEHDLKEYAESKGLLWWKFVSPGLRGVPDRILIAPQGVVVFVEMKAPGKRLAPVQKRRAKELENLHQIVVQIDSVEEGKELIDRISS